MEFINALISLINPSVLMFLLVGVFLGSLIGTLPGLTATMGIALLVPLTFWLDSTSGFAMLIGLWNSAIWSGGISAILINTPGTPASIMTTLDGYELTKKGHARLALDINTVGSVFGGLFSTLILIIFAFPLSKVTLKFGPPEYFALGVFGLTMMIAIGGTSLLKSLTMGIAGLLIATIGSDAVVGAQRFTFGNINLIQGINFIAMLIGALGLSEILYQIATREFFGNRDTNIKFEDEKINLSILKKIFLPSIASSGVGIIVGAIPAAGGDIASIISYGQAKKLSKNPQEYGRGSLVGLAISCVTNNSVIGGALITMLTLGIPGDTVTAILIGALISYGVQPGAQMFTNNATLVYTIMCLMILANIIILIYGLLMTRVMSKFLKLKKEYIWISVCIFSLIGSYALQYSLFDVFIMLLFSLIGLIAKINDYPLGPFILGFLLEAIIESNFNRSLVLSYGSVNFLWSRPITMLFLGFSILSVLISMIIESRNRKKNIEKLNNN